MQAEKPYFLVVGLGASGLSMAKFLSARGESVVATDIDATRNQHAPELNAMGVKTEIGFHDQDTFTNAAALIPSPGIPLSVKYIKTALEKGVPLRGELDIFSQHNKRPVIAITGTNGKTTTTTLIGDMIRACGKKVFVGGNIGTPLVRSLMDDIKADFVVAEISSFQLDITSTFKPDVAVLLNISEDHLDRYEDFNAYADAKWRIFENQTSSETAVINGCIDQFAEKSKKLAADVLSFCSDDGSSTGCAAGISKQAVDIRITGMEQTLQSEKYPQFPGIHNLENMAAALLACIAAGMDMDGMIKGIKNFKQLPHRMEFVKTIDEISFYNDSKATNTDAVIKALGCFKDPVVLILGGRVKDTDFSQLTDCVKKHVKTIIAIGESKEQIKQTFQKTCTVTRADTMADAVKNAFSRAQAADIVLLSPACASFDMFSSYAHRGNEFVSCVSRLKGRSHEA